MHEPVQTYEHAGLPVAIHYDDAAGNPRKEFDNMATIVGWRNTRHVLGDRQISLDYTEQLEVVSALREDGARLILPIHYSEQSGTLSVGDPSDLDDPDYDSDGVIYATGEQLRHEYRLERISAKAIDRATRVLRGEVAEYGAYLAGEVFGYTVTDHAGEHLDSCWGFYELEHCEAQANDAAEYCAQMQAAEAREAHEMACRGIQTLAA
jgi:hypothetical protein